MRDNISKNLGRFNNKIDGEENQYIENDSNKAESIVNNKTKQNRLI